ncbi:MAG: heat shock protein HspQ [Bdellovibrionales bacterium]|nr:heat shock protein HspQ [Bdellovibrionales bacterium]
MAQLRLIKGGKYHEPPESQTEPLYFEGQVVTHRLFEYRGVIVGVDRMFKGTEDWYDRVARSRPPKDHPWYEVLVDKASHSTYVAERNLVLEADPRPVQHPLLNHFFTSFVKGVYQ